MDKYLATSLRIIAPRPPKAAPLKDTQRIRASKGGLPVCVSRFVPETRNSFFDRLSRGERRPSVRVVTHTLERSSLVPQPSACFKIVPVPSTQLTMLPRLRLSMGVRVDIFALPDFKGYSKKNMSDKPLMQRPSVRGPISSVPIKEAKKVRFSEQPAEFFN